MKQITHYLDNISYTLGNNLTAILIIIIGWVIAYFTKKLVEKVIDKSGLNKPFSSKKVKISNLIGKLTFFIVMIFVFTLALNSLGMEAVLEPVKNMLNEFLGYLPNIFGAFLVGYIGYMLATIISELVGFSGETIHKFIPILKLPENINLVDIIKKLVFIFIFIPLLITALNILQMDAISEPASQMLAEFFNAIPKILLAVVILVVSIIIANFLSKLVVELLNSLHLNKVLKEAKITTIFGENNFVSLIGKLVAFYVIFFGLITAIEKLEFVVLTDILNTTLNFTTKVLIGLVIILIGNWIASFASDNFSKKNGNTFVATIIKVAIISIFLAISLRTMGIADDIINLAFGISLGTVALTIILSFGLGGREAAGDQMKKIIDKFNKK